MPIRIAALARVCRTAALPSATIGNAGAGRCTASDFPAASANESARTRLTNEAFRLFGEGCAVFCLGIAMCALTAALILRTPPPVCTPPPGGAAAPIGCTEATGLATFSFSFSSRRISECKEKP